MIHGGYTLQPRSFDISEAAHLPPCTREVWFYLLRNVNHADKGNYKRGQGFFKFSDIQEALHWFVGYRKVIYSKPQITKALRRLNEGIDGEPMTATAKATRGVVITICNYNYYQDPKNYEGNGEGSTKETRRDLEGHTKNKNVKKEELKKDLKTPSSPTATFPHSEHFESFWTHYPKRNGKRVGKGDALAKYKIVVKTEEEANLLFDCVTNYSDECVQTDSYPMDAKRWLVAGRWAEYKPDAYEAPVETIQKQSKPVYAESTMIGIRALQRAKAKEEEADRERISSD